MKQKIIIVDENDVPIGLKHRNEIDFKHDIYRCSAVWVVNADNESLIAQRKFTKDKDPGKWGPAVAGTLEEGETYESNAYKEIREELGVAVVSLEVGPKSYISTPHRYFGQWFFCTLDTPADEFVLQEDEVEQVAWMAQDKLIEDIRQSPDKYIPGFAGMVGHFFSKS